MPQNAVTGVQPQLHKTKYQKREPAGEREALQLLELSEKRKRALESAKEAHLLAAADAEERLQQTLLAKLEAIEAAKRQAVARHVHREERRAAYIHRRQQSATEIQAVWRGRKGRAIATRRRAAGKYIIKWVRNKKQLKVFFRAAKCAAVLRLASGVGAWVQALVLETRQQLLIFAVARQFKVQRAMNGIKAFLSERVRYWRCRRLIAVMRIVHFLRKNTRRRRLNRNRKLRSNRRKPAPQRRRSSSPLEINPAAQLAALNRARGTVLNAQQKAHAQGSPTGSGSALHSAASTGNVLGKLSRQGSVSSVASAHSTTGPNHSHGSNSSTAAAAAAAASAAKLGAQLDGYSTPGECSDEFVSRPRSNPVMFTASSGGFDLNIEGRPGSRDLQQSVRRQQFEAELAQRRLQFMNKKQQQQQQHQPQQQQQQQQQHHLDGFTERARSSTDAVVATDQLTFEATASRSVVQLGKLPDSRLEEARAFARKKAEQDAAAKQKADTEAAQQAAAKAESDAARAAHDERVRRERYAAIDRMRARKKTEAEAQQRATDDAAAARKAELAAKAAKMQEALKAKTAAAAAATAAAAAAAKSSAAAKTQQQAALKRGSIATLSRAESVKDSANGLLPQLLSHAVVHRAPSSQAILETVDAHTTTGQRRVSRLRASSSTSSSGSGSRPRSSANSDKATVTATAPALHSSSKSVGELRKSSSAGPIVAVTKAHPPHANRNTSTSTSGKSATTSNSSSKHVTISFIDKQSQQQPQQQPQQQQRQLQQQEQQNIKLMFLPRAQTGLKDRYDAPSKLAPLPRSSLPASTASAAQKAVAAAKAKASSSSTVHTKQILTAQQHGTTVGTATPIASRSDSSDAVAASTNSTVVQSAVVFADDFLDVDDDTVAAFW
jgi:hypothetical protein